MTVVEPQGDSEKDADIGGCARRAAYPRRLLPPFAPKASKRDDADLRDLIQRIALDNRHYGYRRIAQTLGREGCWSTTSACCG